MSQKGELIKYNSVKNAVGYLHHMGWKNSSKSMCRHIANGWIGKHLIINSDKRVGYVN
jgi:hypothetical protein